MKEDIKKLLEKQNFLTLLKYITLEEIGSSDGTGKKALERLFNKYSDEIRRVNNSTLLYKAILQHQVKRQNFDPILSV